MIHVNEVIVVEGKYDRLALSRIVDGVIVSTDGFGIFNDPEKLQTLRTLASEKGLILLTDSDRSGMAIRNYLIGAIAPERIKNAYIPDLPGKEKRKRIPSKEGKLGVEGVPEEILKSILQFAAAPPAANGDPVTNADLYAVGLLGGENSARRRAEYQKKLGLPAHMSPKKFLEMLNLMRTKTEFYRDFEEKEHEV